VLQRDGVATISSARLCSALRCVAVCCGVLQSDGVATNSNALFGKKRWQQ